ncbi:hypothetical protein LVJ94_11700 [Pendulispora rubella]|uniref:Uncharacterized protein n=1 Tax=Pendulispora rubella TaxID=2741070 RepID=A0ABZ2LAE4_9BACT
MTRAIAAHAVDAMSNTIDKGAAPMALPATPHATLAASKPSVQRGVATRCPGTGTLA